MITDIEDYFRQGCGRCERFATADCATQHWAQGLAELRQICLGAGLTEVLRWGHPCYQHQGRNVAILGAFRQDFRVNFFQAALLNDSEGLLEKQGAQSQTASMLRFVRTEDVAHKAAALRRLLAEAMQHVEAGTPLPKVATALELPEELQEALSLDEALAEAFARLTPGRQRSYVIALASAKKPDTRRQRVERFRGPILAGKGALER